MKIILTKKSGTLTSVDGESQNGSWTDYYFQIWEKFGRHAALEKFLSKQSNGVLESMMMQNGSNSSSSAGKEKNFSQNSSNNASDVAGLF